MNIALPSKPVYSKRTLSFSLYNQTLHHSLSTNVVLLDYIILVRDRNLQGVWTITSQPLCCYQSQVLVAVRGPMTAISGRRFATDADVNQAVTYRLRTLDTDFFNVGMQALVSGWDKC